MIADLGNQPGPSDTNAWSTNYDNPTYGATTTTTSSNNEEAITDLYMSDGDDYYIDDTALSDAQTSTGDNSTAASVSGSSSGGTSETNSNVNTGVFGGLSKAAHPGYSLW